MAELFSLRYGKKYSTCSYTMGMEVCYTQDLSRVVMGMERQLMFAPTSGLMVKPSQLELEDETSSPSV